jgi:hypothetical protein
MNLYLVIREFTGPFLKQAIEIVITSERDKCDRFNLLKLYLIIVLTLTSIISYLLIWRIFAESMASNVNVSIKID